MKTSRSGIALRRGDTWARRFYWSQSGERLNLTYVAEARFQIRVPGGDADDDVIAEASYTGGTARIFPEQGTVDIFIRNTADAPLGSFECDLELTWFDGTVQSTPKIPVTIIDDVTTYGEAKQSKPKVALRYA